MDDLEDERQATNEPSGEDPGGFVTMVQRSEVRRTGDPAAVMWYTAEKYARCLVHGYGIKLVGWPPDVEFARPSEISGDIATLTLPRNSGTAAC